MCQCGFAKIGWKKIKNFGSVLSVVILDALLQFGQYVFGHMSKWFVFAFMFKFQGGLLSLERSSYLRL
jgi:hypothetical protein